MNWLHFLSLVTMVYTIYYIVLVLFDAVRNKPPITDVSGVLHFSEDILPKKIEHLPDKGPEPQQKAVKPDSPIIGSGGVSLKNLFGLCREEAIIYTRPVSF